MHSRAALPLLALAACCAAGGTAAADTYGAYEASSDVEPHSKIALDVQAATEQLSADDYGGAKVVYTAGGNSPKGSGLRTLQGMATHEDLDEHPVPKKFVDMLGTEWADKLQLEALDGTGDFAGKSDEIRTTVAKKNLICITTIYAVREMGDALVKQEDGEDAAAIAHAWDEAVAFWYGPSDELNTGYEAGLPTARQVQEKRDAEFDTNAAQQAMDAFKAGLTASQASNKEGMQSAMDDVVKALTVSYLQATLKYAYKMQTVTPVPEKEWAEGFTYWRCMAGNVYGANGDVARMVDDLLSPANAAPDGMVYCKVKEALETVYSQLGLNAVDVGVFNGITGDPCSAAAMEDYEEEAHPHVEHEDYEEEPAPPPAPEEDYEEGTAPPHVEEEDYEEEDSSAASGYGLAASALAAAFALRR